MPKMSPPMSWVPSCRHKSNCWLAMKLGIWPKRREKIFKCSKSNSNLWSTCLEEKLGRVNHFYPSWRQFMDIPFAVLCTNVFDYIARQYLHYDLYRYSHDFTTCKTKFVLRLRYRYILIYATSILRKASSVLIKAYSRMQTPLHDVGWQ